MAHSEKYQALLDKLKGGDVGISDVSNASRLAVGEDAPLRACSEALSAYAEGGVSPDVVYKNMAHYASTERAPNQRGVWGKALKRFGEANGLYVGKSLLAESGKKGRLTETAVKRRGGGVDGFLKLLEDRGLKPSSASISASILALIGGAFFLSSNITGNAVAGLSTGTSSWIGGVLLAIGLVAGFFWVKGKN